MQLALGAWLITTTHVQQAYTEQVGYAAAANAFCL